MSTPESAGEPLDDTDNNVLAFIHYESQDTQNSEFEAMLMRTLASENNVNFLFEEANELGVDFRDLLNESIGSYRRLYDVFRQGRPLFYLGEDRKMHRLDEDTDEPKAV
jgi:hypothetical protein